MSKLNEFTEKKLGEVLAFCLVGQDTVQKGRALESTLGAKQVGHYQKELAELAAKIGEEASEVTRTKSEKTSQKLKKLRDIYIGDEWDNATEIMEWLGFFEGAAIVHWFLILGNSEARNDLELATLAKRAVDLHQQQLKLVEEELRAVGSDGAEQD